MNSPPPLLLLHDGGDDGVWDPIVDRLPGFVQVAVVGLPAAASVPRAADLVAARARGTGQVLPHVVGHAFGGAVALEVARRMPVSGVTAFCPFGFWTRPHAWYTAARHRSVRGFPHAWRYAFRHPESITAPVLLAWGRRDRIVPPADAGRARRRLPQARQVVVPGSGHLVMRDDPTTAAAVIFEWHQRISGITRE